jgi:hypothetical protein
LRIRKDPKLFDQIRILTGTDINVLDWDSNPDPKLDLKQINFQAKIR